MQLIYSFLIHAFQVVLPFLGIFIPKLKEFRQVRSGVFEYLKKTISGENHVIWVHAASLGEYEQAVPVLEELRTTYPKHKILLTFFSPSGYEIKKNTPLADAVTYLPLDTKQNASYFLEIVKPELALFIKYEFWPNYLSELYKSKIPTLLISGVFRPEQPFFKFYGKWMLSSFKAFNYFFLQNEESLKHLSQLGFTNAEVSGDTRFDRVTRQLGYDNELSFINEFKQDKLLLVCGSTWPEDETLLVDFINEYKGLKVVIAPHKIDIEKIEKLKAQLKTSVACYSERSGIDLAIVDILIIDTIGLLSKIYSYASIAYVGGAAGSTGMHNILEPATFGVPIITGIHIDKFPEALELRRIAGLYTVETPAETSALLKKFFENSDFREQTGLINADYVAGNTGATQKIMDYLRKNQTLTASFK